jgi:SAM-dependent methyltransferase
MEPEALRTKIDGLVRAARARGAPCDWFESLYRDAAGRTELVPWADDAPNPHFVAGMALPGMPTGGRALVLGCGFGDDAEALADLGFDVTAFDISPSAIEGCRSRHPDSRVRYEVQDLFQLPDHYRRDGFDLVLEVYTLQAIPPSDRTGGFGAVADCVAAGGVLLAVMRGRDDDVDADLEGPPWPISRVECGGFETGGLVLESWEDFTDGEDPPNRRFRALFRRRPA